MNSKLLHSLSALIVVEHLVYTRVTGYYNAMMTSMRMARGVKIATSPVGAVTPGGIVATIVWDDTAVEDIVLNDEFLERLGSGGIHLCMSEHSQINRIPLDKVEYL